MKKIFTYIFVVTALFIISAVPSRAQNFDSDSSAQIRKQTYASQYDARVLSLEEFLSKFNSPLSNYAPQMIAYADAYGLDYRMVPAISGVESTFGKYIPANSYNAYGWVNGKYSFRSWPDSIRIVTMTLKREYIDKGLDSINRIARVYAPPSSTWGNKVRYFMNQIDPVPLSYDI